jgi:hypothetical protein
MAWLSNFINSVRFNFVNFFAYSFFLAYVFLSAIIIIQDAHASNPHVSEIRNQIGNICLIIIGFYFGASKGGKEKDEALHTVIQSNVKKDEAIVEVTQANKDLTQHAKDLTQQARDNDNK